MDDQQSAWEDLKELVRKFFDPAPSDSFLRNIVIVIVKVCVVATFASYFLDIPIGFRAGLLIPSSIGLFLIYITRDRSKHP
jgi:hypothetical protein